MASFHGKIGWKGQRKRENKIFATFRSFPTGKREFQKNKNKIEKIEKIEKYHYGFIPRKNRLEKAEKGRK